MINQETVDRAVVRCNKYIGQYRRQHPSHDFLAFPQNQRIVHLKNLEELSEISDSLAAHHGESGRIYIMKQNVERAIQEFEQKTEEISDLFYKTYRRVEDFLLYSIIVHENVHRSCRIRALPKALTEPYTEIAKEVFFYNEEVKNLLEKEGKWKSQGFRLHRYFKGDNGRRALSFPPELDEFLAHYFTAEIISENFVSEGFFEKNEQARLAHFVHTLGDYNQEEIEFGLKNLERLKTTSFYNSFVAIYLKGNLPQSLHEAYKRNNDTYNVVFNALGANIIGEIKGIVEIITALNHNK